MVVASDRPLALVLFAIRVRAGFGLAVHPREWRGGFGAGALLLVLVLFGLFLLPVASHLTFRHGDLQILDG
jgi:hypothetical protein